MVIYPHRFELSTASLRPDWRFQENPIHLGSPSTTATISAEAVLTAESYRPWPVVAAFGIYCILEALRHPPPRASYEAATTFRRARPGHIPPNYGSVGRGCGVGRGLG
ncbi:MAG: hypothetical protein WCE87_13870, partial [Candidatus Udaeobacter sp.]